MRVYKVYCSPPGRALPSKALEGTEQHQPCYCAMYTQAREDGKGVLRTAYESSQDKVIKAMMRCPLQACSPYSLCPTNGTTLLSI